MNEVFEQRKLKLNAQPLQSLSQQLVETPENERRQLARELHDEIGQALTALQLHLQAALGRGEGAADSSHLRESLTLVRELIRKTEDLSLSLRPSLRAGAAGHWLKEAAVEELQAALPAVMAESTEVSSSLRPGLAGRLNPDTRPQPGPLDKLTPRQLDVLQRIAQSQTTKEIALRLNLSPKTVEFHRMELMKRLHIHDVPGLVRFALQHGLLAPPD
jgi:DNA-binding NarL/FixJ family response regulator